MKLKPAENRKKSNDDYAHGNEKKNSCGFGRKQGHLIFGKERV
jgi:hypothetical protein